ncbi:hypothetical protein E3N88_15146 [Mikania micrantha]|uniref:Uncharacterized protein n=1 Tax=Mikania micrantha TaxID=192012 RepID=A0A5N6NXC1_9ASTR|nr:hypothetical protein E3N88_15146 [Mikania micrantha]
MGPRGLLIIAYMMARIDYKRETRTVNGKILVLSRCNARFAWNHNNGYSGLNHLIMTRTIPLAPVVSDLATVRHHDYNWVWLLPYLLRGKYDVAPIYALWGKYGCSSTCYWVSMGAPVLVTGTCYWVSMDLQNA